MPDVERLAAMPPQELQRLHELLSRSGYDATYLSSLSRLGERLGDRLRAPLRIWHLRRRADPAALLARLFAYGDTAPVRELEKIAGDVAPLVRAGLVQHDGDALASGWRITPFGRSWIVGDALDGGSDAVMAAGGLTGVLAEVALPVSSGARCLDLGCGAGALAIALAQTTDHVVATDVSPRAAVLAAFNARLNGVRVATAVGDLFESVRGERFDTIVCQPPFIAAPSDAAHVTFRHGGLRGDELALRAARGAALHLTTGGRAYILADWPVTGDDLAARVRRAVGASGSVTLFLAPHKDLDEVVAHYAAAARPALDGTYRDEAIALREHHERAGIRALATGLVVLGEGGSWTHTVPIRHTHDAPLTNAVVGRWLHALAVAHDPVRLASAALVLPTGATLTDGPVALGEPSFLLRTASAVLVLSAKDAGDLGAVTASRAPRDATTCELARKLLLRGALVPG